MRLATIVLALLLVTLPVYAAQPQVHARAAAVYDVDADVVVWSKNDETPRPIASITKIMTALVAIEDERVPLTQQIRITQSDVYRARRTYLRKGDRVTKDDLIHLLLVTSDNAAARALARTSSYGRDGFIATMNARAMELGLRNTVYVDASGLLAGNRSTPTEQARLLVYVAGHTYLSDVMQQKSYRIVTKQRRFHVPATNRLLRTAVEDVKVIGGKTGYTRRAGYCFAAYVEHMGKRLAIVVLGARSNAARFLETKKLLRWMDTGTN